MWRGLGKHVAELLPALARQGIEAHLLTPLHAQGDALQRGDALMVHRIPKPTFCLS